jgi:hypothetical protein
MCSQMKRIGEVPEVDGYVPERARHADAKGERKYSSFSFLALELDEGEWSASRPGRALLRGKDPRYPLDRSLGGRQCWSEFTG